MAFALTADVVLSQKLAEELQYEKTAAAESSDPEFLKSFKDEGVWNIEDVAGNDEVALTRKFGNESIRLMFSIADIQTQEEDPAFEEGQEGEDGATEDDPIHSYGIRVAFSVTKVFTLIPPVCWVELTFLCLGEWSWMH